MKILKQGAEAIIYEDEFDGQRVLVKERVKKRYRIPQIDDKLRKTRTKQEIKLMRESRGIGILTPRVISSDDNSAKILMEKIDGTLMKDFLNSSKIFAKISFKLGEEIGKMHSVGIIHGDLTTSNMILSDGKIFFIDFGLGYFSKRIEDMATDLNVMIESLQATHNKIAGSFWKNFIQGYKSINNQSDKVFSQLEKLKKRGRYTEK